VNNKLDEISEKLMVLEQATEKKIIELYNIINEKENEIHNLNSNINTYIEEIKNLKSKNEKLNDTINHLNLKKRELEEFIKVLQKRVLESNEKQMDSSNFITAVEDIRWEYEEIIEKLKKENEELLLIQKKDYEETINNLNQILKKKETEFTEQLSKDREFYSTKLKELEKNKLDSEKKELLSLQQELNSLRKENQDLRLNISSLELEIVQIPKTFQNEILKLIKEKNLLQSKIEFLKKQNYEIKKDYNEKIKAYEEKCKYLEKENSELNEEIIILKENYENQLDKVIQFQFNENNKCLNENIIAFDLSDKNQNGSEKDIIYFKIKEDSLIEVQTRPENGIFVSYNKAAKKWQLFMDKNSSMIEIKKSERLIRYISRYGWISKDFKKLGSNKPFEIIKY